MGPRQCSRGGNRSGSRETARVERDIAIDVGGSIDRPTNRWRSDIEAVGIRDRTRDLRRSVNEDAVGVRDGQTRRVDGGFEIDTMSVFGRSGGDLWCDINADGVCRSDERDRAINVEGVSPVAATPMPISWGS